MPVPGTRWPGPFPRVRARPWPSPTVRCEAEPVLPDDVLTEVERMSVAHSIESRVPLLDNEVMAFASTLPAAFKIQNGRRKHGLKEVAATLLPRDILDRKKQGFGAPLGTWFRRNLRELVADTLLSPSSLQRGYFQPLFVRQLVDEHLAGTYDLEVIDIFQQPELAKVDQILAVPTLIRKSPLPPPRFIGDLSDRDVVLARLDVQRKQGP